MTTATMTEETLNELLQGVIAAVETYVQALAKFRTKDHEVLEQIKIEHVEDCNKLRAYVHHQMVTPEHGSGIWGAWSKLAEGAAKIFGRGTALKALKEGEEYGVREYLRALETQPLPREVRTTILDRFIPSGQRHIELLDLLIKQQ